MKFTRRILSSQDQRGVAVLIALFTIAFIFFLVKELLYESNVEYIVHSQAINRIKAHYAAKAGHDLSLLRIKVYAKLQQQFGSKIPAEQKNLLDMVWNLPFAWPPIIPEETNSVDQELISDKVKESKMDATYRADIFDEGSKIDINDLGSPSKGLQKITQQLLMQIFENRMENDEEWRKNNEDFDFKKLIALMKDWVDDDTISDAGGDERDYYDGYPQKENLPPNRGFRTLAEIRLIPGMTEEAYKMIADRCTVYGIHAINPNYASREVLMALDVSITDEVATEILNRRNDAEKGGPFKTAGDFWEFVNVTARANVPQEKQDEIPLVFESVYNFRIRSVGEYGGITHQIDSVVLDFGKNAATIAKRLNDEAKEASGGGDSDSGGGGGGGGAAAGGNSSQTNNDPLPKGPPRIVYYMER